MAVDNRPFKSKEQDGQGNEVIIRDQQLVEQGTATTMASGACFETRDVDDRPVKIPRDNMMNIVLECIGIILNDSSRNLGTNVQKTLGLQGNTVGHSTVADFASVLGVNGIIKANTILGFSGSTVNNLIYNYLTNNLPNLFKGTIISSGYAGDYNELGGSIVVFSSPFVGGSIRISGIFIDWYSSSTRNFYLFSAMASSSGALSNLAVQPLQ